MDRKMYVLVDRFFAWALFIFMLAYFVTGYGMTKNLIDPKICRELHNVYLVWAIFFSFAIHSFCAIRSAFARWKILNALTLAILIIFYLILSAGFIFMQSFYSADQQTSDLSQEASQSPRTVESTSTTAKIFSSQDLLKYNGKDGQKSYVAVEGKVYDMTNVFKNGKHYGHEAGKELTESFFSKHIKSEITKYPVVGIYVK